MTMRDKDSVSSDERQKLCEQREWAAVREWDGVSGDERQRWCEWRWESEMVSVEIKRHIIAIWGWGYLYYKGRKCHITQLSNKWLRFVLKNTHKMLAFECEFFS